ncbi:MAG TPA: hypothetical protein VHM90_21010, partial [Phycisphaerae bacterium]|nr:hypothetical protein [Phycisphaerae bacterium]
APAEYRLVVGVNATTPSQKSIENDWNFWLYPSELPADAPADVLITTDWNAAQAKLTEGGKVFFTPPASMLDPTCPPLATRPIFWNRVMNNTGAGGLSQVGFLGLLVDGKHPALAQFPTENFCDFQWTDVTNGVRAINLESVPYQLVPVVQAIDDWNRGFKLGVVFEVNVGKGKLLVSAINLDPNAPGARGGPGAGQSSVARQLRHSLLAYAASDKFAPKVTLNTDQANALWPSTRPPGYKAPKMPTISTQPNANPGDVVEPTDDRPTPR